MIVMAKSDIGKMRQENQDCYRVREISSDTALAVVCDGMGGTHGGGIASEVAINAIFEKIFISYRPEMEPKSIKNLLTSAISTANTIVFNKGREEPENRGMGTTCVLALTRGNDVFMASVGDSRGYHISDGIIEQVTKDHTYIAMLREKGLPTEYGLSSMKNVITRAVGVEETVEPDYFEFTAKKGDVIFLCTDGLTNHVSDEIILEATYLKPPEEALTKLINTANSNGGKDNITAAIIAL